MTAATSQYEHDQPSTRSSSKCRQSDCSAFARRGAVGSASALGSFDRSRRTDRHSLATVSSCHVIKGNLFVEFAAPAPLCAGRGPHLGARARRHRSVRCGLRHCGYAWHPAGRYPVAGPRRDCFAAGPARLRTHSIQPKADAAASALSPSTVIAADGSTSPAPVVPEPVLHAQATQRTDPKPPTPHAQTQDSSRIA